LDAVEEQVSVPDGGLVELVLGLGARGLHHAGHLVDLAVEAARGDEARELAVDKVGRDAKGLCQRGELHALVRLEQLRVGLDAQLAHKEARVLAEVEVQAELILHVRERLEEERVVAVVERVEEVAQVRHLVESGGDWDRRNRLKVYQAVQYMRTRNWKKATDLLVDTLSTFTSTELFSYTQFVSYTVVLSVLSLHRTQLKAKVLNAPEVLAVIDEVPHLRDFLNAFYHSNYALFFQALAHLQDQLRLDLYLGQHSRYFVREMRIKAYAQLLESYKSMQLTALASAFGVTPDFIDAELSRFIASGRLHCKIDKVAGVVETARSDTKSQLYQTTIRNGDLLLNRIQKLSRVINL